MYINKCIECGKRGYSCCQSLPVFTGDELAELHYKSSVIEDNKLQIYKIGSNEYTTAKSEWITSKGIDPYKYTCPFYNTDEYTCNIYELRPSMCRVYGSDLKHDCGFTQISLAELRENSDDVLTYLRTRVAVPKYKTGTMNIFNLASGLLKQQKMNRKMLKGFKEDILFYYLLNIMQNMDDDTRKRYSINLSYSYKLVMVSDGRIAGLQIPKYTAEINSPLRALCDLHNKVVLKLYLKPLEYHKLVRDKLTKITNGTKFKQVPLTDESKRNGVKEIDFNIFVVTTLLYKYYYEYKLKSEQFKGLVKKNDLYNIRKYYNIQWGATGTFDISPMTEIVNHNAEVLYKNWLSIR